MYGSEQDAVATGEVIAGKYRVDRVIGQGGMGVVLQATHLELDQKVAIKMLLPALMASETSVERFLREARASVRLRSEHVARVIDVGRTEAGAPFMVMEYLEGSDLAGILERRRRLSIEEAADFVLQACEAVAEAHSLGIVHRDLKPANLFVTRRVGGQPLVKVLDFGISKSTDGLRALTQTTSVVGSPMYMAPEQLRSAKLVDSRSDVWALGVVLRELVTGRLPFEADSIPELTLKVFGEAARPVREDAPEAPDEIVAIIDRCLQKNPDDRFPTVGDLATALEPFCAPETVGTASRAVAVITGSTHGGRTMVSSDGGNAVRARRSQAGVTPSSGVSSRGAVVVETPQRVSASPPARSGSKALVLAGVAFAVLGGLGAFAIFRPSREPAPRSPEVAASAPEAPRPAASAPTVTAVEAPPPAVSPAVSASAAPSAKPGPKGKPGAAPPPPGPKPKGDEIPSMR